MTLLLTGSDVADLLTLDDCIAAVEEAFRAHGEGRLHPPGILSAHEERGAFHIKTAAVNGRFGAKANANFPGQVPSIQGVMLLFDASNGRPLAILDSIELTVLRTGAATAVAAKYLARRDSRTAMIYGAGRQGRVQLDAVSRVLPIERVYVHDVDQERAEKFAYETGAQVRLAESPDVIITCTPSKQAFLETPAPFIAAVGADNPSKSEIAPSLMRSSRVVADLADQCAEIGDLRTAIAAGAMSRDDVHAELGAIVAGRKPGRTRDDEVFIFDSTGIGFQDTAAASIAYDRAIRGGRGLEVNLAR
jgi:ornithine cyclodeaminase/alanine dehydrogenase-like protein (mu-crystallin family)